MNIVRYYSVICEVADVLMSYISCRTKNSESEARKDIEKRGYKRVDPQQVKIERVLMRLKTEYKNCSEDILKTAIGR